MGVSEPSLHRESTDSLILARGIANLYLLKSVDNTPLFLMVLLELASFCVNGYHSDLPFWIKLVGFWPMLWIRVEKMYRCHNICSLRYSETSSLNVCPTETFQSVREKLARYTCIHRHIFGNIPILCHFLFQVTDTRADSILQCNLATCHTAWSRAPD